MFLKGVKKTKQELFVIVYVFTPLQMLQNQTARSLKPIRARWILVNGNIKYFFKKRCNIKKI